MKPVDDIEKLIERIDVTPGAEMDRRTLDDILDAQEKAEKAGSADFTMGILKSGMIKVAAAAIIMIAILFGMNQFGGSIDGTAVAWGIIVDCVETSNTVTYKAVFRRDNAPEIQTWVTFMSPHFLRRQVLPDGKIDIYNYPERRHLILDPKEKNGRILEYANIASGANDLPDDIKSFFGRHPWEWFRRKYEQYGEFTGHEIIDGVSTNIFVAKYDSQNIKVWTHQETNLPVFARIEYLMYPLTGEKQAVQCSLILSNFIWNGQIDRSLFSISPPVGYKIEHQRIDVSDETEEALIEGLRAYSELYNGRFPDKLEDSTAIKITTDLMTADVEKDQRVPIYQKFLKVKTAVQFVGKLNSDNEWRYLGDGTKYGDAETAIFRYRPTGSDVFRVIYGDLTTENVRPEHLPQ